eukprot:12300853-Alexandrium_andersonii.AAC.1
MTLINSLFHALNKHALCRSLAAGGGRCMLGAMLSRRTTATALLFTACALEEAWLELQFSSLHAPPSSSFARNLVSLAVPPPAPGGCE